MTSPTCGIAALGQTGGLHRHGHSVVRQIASATGRSLRAFVANPTIPLLHAQATTALKVMGTRRVAACWVWQQKCCVLWLSAGPGLMVSCSSESFPGAAWVWDGACAEG